MKIETFWWGAELRPESPEEWATMTTLFSNVTDCGRYDRGPDDPPAEIVHGPDLMIRIDR